MQPERYPLCWPLGYKRTNYRKIPIFKTVPLGTAVAMVVLEIKRLSGVSSVLISSNVPLRLDGMPRADFAHHSKSDPGVAVYFKYEGADTVLCCDKFLKVEDNLKAIAVTVEDMRRIERNGVSDFIKRSFTGFKELPQATNGTARSWLDVFGFSEAPRHFSYVEYHYKQLAKALHPDKGGELAEFQELNEAFDQARKHYKI